MINVRIKAGYRFAPQYIRATFSGLPDKGTVIRLCAAVLANRPKDGSWQSVTIEFRRDNGKDREWRRVGASTMATITRRSRDLVLRPSEGPNSQTMDHPTP